MARKDERYVEIIVESFIPAFTAGRHGEVHIRPIPGQDPYTVDMYVACSDKLIDTSVYNIGTRFKILAKITDREDGVPYIYSHYKWPFEVVFSPPHQ